MGCGVLVSVSIVWTPPHNSLQSVWLSVKLFRFVRPPSPQYYPYGCIIVCSDFYQSLCRAVWTPLQLNVSNIVWITAGFGSLCMYRRTSALWSTNHQIFWEKLLILLSLWSGKMIREFGTCIFEKNGALNVQEIYFKLTDRYFRLSVLPKRWNSIVHYWDRLLSLDARIPFAQPVHVFVQPLIVQLYTSNTQTSFVSDMSGAKGM